MRRRSNGTPRSERGLNIEARAIKKWNQQTRSGTTEDTAIKGEEFDHLTDRLDYIRGQMKGIRMRLNLHAKTASRVSMLIEEESNQLNLLCEILEEVSHKKQPT